MMIDCFMTADLATCSVLLKSKLVHNLSMLFCKHLFTESEFPKTIKLANLGQLTAYLTSGVNGAKSCILAIS